MSFHIYPYLNESGPENMASDYWLFHKSISSSPIFRHYGWVQPEITFGYGQDWNWVKNQEMGESKKFTRRPTGGGIVKHGKDWTYTLILPSGHPSFFIPALDLYEKIHESIGLVLAKQGYETKLMPCPLRDQRKKGIPGNCFLEPVGRDLMTANGLNKLAGAAMKRTKIGILIQGTIDLVNIENLDLAEFQSSYISELSKLVCEETVVMEWMESFFEERLIYINQFASSTWRENRKLS